MNIRVRLALLFIFSLTTTLVARPAQEKRRTRESEIVATIEAIQDEIYSLKSREIR